MGAAFNSRIQFRSSICPVSMHNSMFILDFCVFRCSMFFTYVFKQSMDRHRYLYWYYNDNNNRNDDCDGSDD